MNKEEKSSNKCPICGRPTHKESKYCIFHASAEEKNEEEFKKALKEYVNKIKKEDGDYDFKEFIFVGIINFKKDLNITVFKNTHFTKATFKEVAFFWEATFEGDADFWGATFEGDAHFGVKSFVNGVNLEKIKAFSGKKLFFKLNNEKGKINFKRAYLENTDLDIELVKGVLIDFTGALLRNTKIRREQIENHILQEKEKEFSKAKEIYLLLKNNFHSIGQYDDESWAFKKEKDMERKSNFHFKTLHKWLWSCFLNALYGYGEKPERVIVSAIAIIIIFAFVFMNFGIDANPQLDTIPKYNILKELFMGIRYGDLLVRLKDISLEQIKNCLYFSTVTFTTLGLGDFRPVEGWGRIFVGVEAFIGALMIALFIYTFARRTGGR
ncbi:hypothetical protein ES695_13110 [Candidatus Atribacteria bacterium 1244-E10-H5-B2]|nr:MAG: hypothetical protein ES695_13110 [Candidatus Atribacteria bacterium 1244-E10-H5-B2]